jgi:hypothetical protein
MTSTASASDSDVNEQILRLLTAPQDLSIDNLQRSALQCVLLVLSLIPLLINLSNNLKSVHHLRALVYCPGIVSLLRAEPIILISSILNSVENHLVQRIASKIRDQGLQYVSAMTNSLKVRVQADELTLLTNYLM